MKIHVSCAMDKILIVVVGVVIRISGEPNVNGVEVPSDDIFKYSFMSSLQQMKRVSLQEDYKHLCGGTVINEKWILTAAHCVDGRSPADLSAVIGMKSVNQNNEEHYNITKIEYSGYDRYSLINDIALLKIFPENLHVQPMPLGDMDPKYGESCKIIGYGAKAYAGGTPNPMSEAYVKLITNDDCIEILGRIMGPQPGNICALGNGTDTCQGDSGGPLICTQDGSDYIFGITSNGSGCGIAGVPSVYTLVKPYVAWIKAVVETQ